MLSDAGSTSKHKSGGEVWAPEHSRDLMQRALAAKAKGDVREAHRLLREGQDWCTRNGQPAAALRFRVTATSIRYFAGDVRAAAAEYLDEEREAKRLEDAEEAAAIRTNLASLYVESHEPDSALHVAEAALAEIGQANLYAKPYLLLILAGIYAEQGAAWKSEQLFEDGLTLALDRELPDAVIRGWEAVGEQKLVAGDLTGAERCFTEAYRYTRLHSPVGLSGSYRLLGQLYFKMGNLKDALRFTNLALNSGPAFSGAVHKIYHQRGSIELAMGHPIAALADFERALRLAALWRDDGLPADVLRTQMNAAVQDIYDSYIQAAMACYRRTSRPEYARAAWEALEGNRAASLRRTLAESGVWRDRLPPEYWLTLASLRQELKSGAGDSARISDLQAHLLMMETRAGLDPASKKNDVSQPFNENIPGRLVLSQFQQTLGARKAVMSFALGERCSYRWVVTRRGIQVRELPSRREFATLVMEFEKAIREGDPSSAATGQRLYSTLFSSLPQPAERAPSWLLSLDDTLFDVPFSALVCSRNRRGPRYLAQRHSTEIVPGAWAVGSTYPPVGPFIGLADAVYNSADPRVSRRRTGVGLFRTRAKTGEMELPRLPGTRQEIESCAREYSAPYRLMFSGPECSRRGLERGLSVNPAVIHFAAHVVPERNGQQGMIILSGTSPGQIDALTVRDIAALRVPGSLVVMSGCGSGRGRVLTGAGWLGLGRAWLSAGARGVVASHWPVADDNGALFQRFYQYLRQSQAASASPAEALRRARADLIESRADTADPKYWAAYEFIGRSN
jgi:CHAT domain-containing protein/tetratricopeptide (TPR) repeat protein